MQKRWFDALKKSDSKSAWTVQKWWIPLFEANT